MKAGLRNMAARIVNGEERFIAYATEHAGITRDEASAALATYRKVGALWIDSVTRDFRVNHGGFLDADVIRRAAAKGAR